MDILTNPAGATVTVDGVSKGVSPIEGLSVESGTHSVTVYLSGYKPQKETVKIANSETKKLLYNLVSEETPIHNPTPTQEETPTTEVTPTSTPTAEESTSPVVSKTPMSLSESKKKELIEVVKQYYGGKDVFVDYGNGVMLVSYSIDSIPNPSDLYDDIQGVLISADYTAGQSGITDVRVVNVVVTTTSERGLGVGNYYVAGERKTFDIDVSDCHP